MKTINLQCPKCGHHFEYKNYFDWLFRTPFHWFGKRLTKCPYCKEKSYMEKIAVADDELNGIKTTDWLIKGISKEQLQEEKIQALTKELNRLEAENESLKESNRLLINNPILDWQDDLENKIKAEAYKECFEKIKVELKDINKIECQDDDYYVLHSTFFDNILKELVGEDNV